MNNRPNTFVTTDGDHITIRTTPRKSEAILLVMSGCTLEEVGQRFGITGERVRQYLKEAGLTSDARKLFRPSAGNDRNLERFTYRSRQKARRKKQVKERMARAVTWLRGFADANGRTPTYGELVTALGIACKPHQAVPYLIAYFRRKWNESSIQGLRRVHFVYRVAGLQVSPRGTSGHRDGGVAVGKAHSKRLRQMWADMTPEQRSNYQKRIHKGRAA